MRIFICLFALLSAGTAQAERWVIKNPRVALSQFSSVRSIQFGPNSYAVVDAPAFTVSSAEFNTLGDAAFRDARVSLPNDVKSEEGSGLADGPEGQMAWHVKSQQYDKLPAQFNGAGMIVAVVDSGVDYKHSALKDHIWTNEKEIPGNGIDDDGNGYVDDVNGWDFEHNLADPMDTMGHGTHCAGIIAASPNADTQAQGVAQGAKIMPIRIIGDKSVGFLTDAIAGIKYAVDNGANVLSNSWRVYKSWDDYEPNDQNIEMLKQAIIYASDHGAIFVAAAGNESLNMDTDLDRDPLFPGGYTGITNFVVVAASDQQDVPAYFTNYGSTHVTVAAPGVDILSTIPNDGWTAMSGTSMAAPLVAGSLARALSEGFTPADSMDRLVATSTAATTWESKVRGKGVIHLMNYLSK